MTTLTIKDVPEPLAEQLRQRAARNHRSLQGELMAIIETAATEKPELAANSTRAGMPSGANRPGAGTVVGLDARGRPIVRRGWKTIEQIAAEHRALFPEPIAGGPLGVDIIREERDSR